MLLCGEPGIGKSRLVQTLVDQVRGETVFWARYQCSPQHGNSALYPVIHQLERAAHFEPGDEAPTRLAKLTDLLTQASDNPERAVSLLAPLLSIALEGSDRPKETSPQRQKDETLNVLVRTLQDFAARRPTLAVFEDVHWIDPTTQELLDLLVDSVRDSRILLLITFRPDYTPPWVGDSHVTLLTLSRLSERERADMVARLVRAGSLGGQAR